MRRDKLTKVALIFGTFILATIMSGGDGGVGLLSAVIIGSVV